MPIQLGGGLQLGGGGIGDLLGWGGLFTSLGSGIAGAFGAAQTASGTAAADLARAQGFDENAAAAGTTAGNIWSAEHRQNVQADYQAERIIGGQKAAYGAAGVNPNSGSPLDLLADTEAQVKQEALNRFYTAQERATAEGQQYTYDEEAAAAAREAAKEAQSSGTLGIFSSLLGGIGSTVKIAASLFGGGAVIPSSGGLLDPFAEPQT